MIPVKVVDSPTFDNFIENISEYADLLIKEKVFVLRGANFTEDQQKNIMVKLGDFFNWYPNSKNREQRRYKENHERVVSIDKETKNDIIVPWHLEHTEYDNPILAATWNMYLFTCEKDVGRTFFVDSASIYKDMPEEWQEFLLKSKENVKKDGISYTAKAVQPHFYTKENVIRVDLTNHNEASCLEFFEDRLPTEEEKNQYKIIRDFFISQVLLNEEIRMFHEWQQGDILFVDLFKMAHSVAGGFEATERSFTGYWAFERG